VLARWVGPIAAASLLLYLVGSSAVRGWWALAPYLRFVARSFAERPDTTVWETLASATTAPRAAAATALLASVGVGIAGWWGMRGSRAAAPMGWVAGMVAAVLPAQIMATLWWPDGQGRLTNEALAAWHLILLVPAWGWALWSWWSRRATHPTRPGRTTPLGPDEGAPDIAPWWALPVVAGAVVV